MGKVISSSDTGDCDDVASPLPGFFEGTEMPNAGWWEALWADPAVVLASVGVKPNMAVMDLCSGDGWFTLQLAKLARHVVAIDIDTNLLKVARHRLAESAITNCDFVAGNAYELTRLWPNPVDFVFLANAFHGVPDRERLAHSVHDALAPTGLFAVVNWHKRPREETTVLGQPRGPRTKLRISPEQTSRAVEAGGLKLVRVVEVPPYHYCAVYQRRAS
jgi:SAM-dependent methyltransferase